MDARPCRNGIRSLRERCFKPWGFVPILDFVHAVTSAYAAATAGRPRSEGWPVDPRYRRLGRPVTSSRVESTVEQLDRRVKGRERFWSKRGRVALR